MTNDELVVAEKATDFIFHWMEDLGAEEEDCLNAAEEMYTYLTGQQLNSKEFFGL